MPLKHLHYEYLVNLGFVYEDYFFNARKYLRTVSLNQFHLIISFTAWFFYGVTISGLLYIKIKFPELPRAYTVREFHMIVTLLRMGK